MRRPSRWIVLLQKAFLGHWALTQGVWAETRQLAANFATDIKGDPDTREGTWGDAGVTEWKIRFSPPPGKRVRVVRAFGDVVAWVRGGAKDGTHSGVLMGLMTTGPDGSRHADWAADNCMLYIQGVVSGSRGERWPFDHEVSAGGLLESDNTLRVRVAVWLNDTGKPVHVETTLNVVYKYE